MSVVNRCLARMALHEWHSFWAASVLLTSTAITALAFAKSAFVNIANPYQLLRAIEGYRLLPMTI